MDNTSLKIEVSIIVPVYNTPKDILQRTFYSIQKQTYSKYELIIVDDGSCKEVGELLDEIVEEFKNKNICARVLHINNGGVSKARNIGIKEAKGDWVCFVDSDDLISKFYVEHLILTAKKYNVNIVCCELQRIYSSDEFKDTESRDFDVTIYTGEDVWKNVNASFSTNKLVKKDIAYEIKFDENRTLLEDFLFINKVLEKYPKVAQLNEILYWYLVNPYSATSLLKAEQCLQAIESYKYGLNISFVKNNKDLYNGRLLGLIGWYFRYCEAVVNEKTENYISICIMIRKEIRAVVDEININEWGIYEKFLFFGFVRSPILIGLLNLKIIRMIRLVRLRLRMIAID